MANAYEIPGFSWTLLTGEDLSALQFSCVDVNSSGLLITPAADGGRVVGVVQNKPGLGKRATIVTDGISKVKVGTGGVTAGDRVQALTNGTITTAASGDYPVGIALQTGAAGTLVAVLLLPSIAVLA